MDVEALKKLNKDKKLVKKLGKPCERSLASASYECCEHSARFISFINSGVWLAHLGVLSLRGKCIRPLP